MLKKPLPFLFTVMLVLVLSYVFLSIIPPHKTISKIAVKNSDLTMDTLISQLKLTLPVEQRTFLNVYENQLLKYPKDTLSYLSLLHFWKDSVNYKGLIPYHYYLGEKGILGNSQKEMIFAGQFFLENMKITEERGLKTLFSQYSSRYFKAVLKTYNNNDSAIIGLAANYIYMDTLNPMQGVMMIKDILVKDSSHSYANKTLGIAAFFSKQYDKAIRRLLKTFKQYPNDVEVLLCLAESYEYLHNKDKAKHYYLKVKQLLSKNDHFMLSLDNKIAHLK